MTATRENVLAAIVKYVEEHKRRAPAPEIALIVNDTLPNVKLVIQELVTAGSINTSRGRNGGILPADVTLDRPVKVAKVKTAKAEVQAENTVDATEGVSDDVAEQFAALVAKLEADEITEMNVAV